MAEKADKLLTPAEAAEYLGVTEKQLRDWRKAENGPIYYSFGPRMTRYDRSRLDEFRKGLAGEGEEKQHAMNNVIEFETIVSGMQRTSKIITHIDLILGLTCVDGTWFVLMAARPADVTYPVTSETAQSIYAALQRGRSN